MGLLQPVQGFHEAVHDSWYAGHSALAVRRAGTSTFLLCSACREEGREKVGLGRSCGLKSR